MRVMRVGGSVRLVLARNFDIRPPAVCFEVGEWKMRISTDADFRHVYNRLAATVTLTVSRHLQAGAG
jgi:hypothetical protein